MPLLRTALRVARAGAVAYLVLLLLMLGSENFLVFRPVTFPDGRWSPADLRFEEVEFASADGTALHGWFLPHAAPRAVVLYLHGNGGNLTFDYEVGRMLQQDMRTAAMLFDYRGFGRSQGSPSEAGALADARAARAWLARRAGVEERDVVLFGRSLGGGLATDLAARDGARGLVLESTFTSLPDVAGWH
jgi:uncharacterized protein